MDLTPQQKDLRKQRSISATDADWTLIKDTAKEAGFPNVSNFVIELVKAYRKDADMDAQ